MKKILSLIASLAMILTLTLTGVSADSTYQIIINATKGHTYEAYQIFKGDLTEKTEDGKTVTVLSNLVWGDGVTTTGQTNLGNAAKKAGSLNSEATAQTFAKTLVTNEYLQNPKTLSVSEDGTTYTISKLEPGYYLIKDKDKSLSDKYGEAYTSYILKVVKNVEMEPKSGTTTSEKKVDDNNDSNNSEGLVWQDSADHDIGDLVSFQLKATIASDYDAYKTYYFAFHDTESAGLTFQPKTVKVFVDGNLIEEGYTVNTDPGDNETFVVEFENLKDIKSVKAGSVITVTYQSILNHNAVLGSSGNPNKMYAVYSNNPNIEQGGTGKTKEDTVIVFTYKVVVNKVNSKNEPLSGATFTLEKFVAETTGTEKYNNINGTWKAINVFETEPDSTFTFKGLDDGIYRLKETVTPEGYNTIDDIYFEVAASHVLESDSPSLTDLNGNKLSGEVTIEFAKNLADGSLTTNVVNQSGTTLPETGGIGTTVFYVLGSVLVIASAVLLINKRKVKE